jgi:hypothetical protein
MSSWRFLMGAYLGLALCCLDSLVGLPIHWLDHRSCFNNYDCTGTTRTLVTVCPGTMISQRCSSLLLL